MIAVISPSVLSGTVTAAAGKSSMQRACALALLNNGTTTIENPGNSNDDLAAINIIRKLGADVEQRDDKLIVRSNGFINAAGAISCGESGLSLRMFAAIAALSKEEIILNGEGSILKRPMHFFDETFPSLGVSVGTNNGYLPIKMKGPLKPASIGINGSGSSQYLTGLLFAFAKETTEPVIIHVKDLASKPYIDLSLQMLEAFGYKVRNDNYERFYIEPVAHTERNITYITETDWSGAAFLLVAGAVAGNIRVKGLDLFSAQADRAIVDVLQAAGADISIEGSCILISNQNRLKAFEFDATDCPDLFPPLVALASYCNGISIIRGTSRLAGKESNRAATLKDVFSKMGILIELKDDTMLLHGGTGINTATVSSHHDHRIAMAAAVAALGSSSAITITDAEAVNKSYPAFFRHLQILGAAVSLIDQ